MRRAQAHEANQIKRNLATNPAFRALGGTLVTRTNSCTDPACETSTGTITLRTNLATNPRGVLTLPDYSGAGNQTITPNIAITNHPEGIATANRVEYAANASNPGVAVLNPAEASTTYTLSAWVYHETAPASSGGQALAQAGIASQPTPPAITQGQWTRVSWTTTTGASPTYFGFRVNAPTTAGAFLITGILIEKAPGLTPFFDGGTTRTNLCTNPSFATDLTDWTTIAATATRITTKGDGHMVEATQITPAQGARQGMIWLNPGGAAIPAGPYTASFEMEATDAAFTDARVILYDTVGAANRALATTPLIKTGMNRYTFNLTATGDFNRVYVEAIGTGIASGTKLWIDHVLLEKGATKGFYFEGAGDITYAWTGTANASTSTEKAPAISRYTLEQGGIAYRDSSYQMTGRHSIKMLGGQGDFYQIAASTTPATWTFSCNYKTDGTVTGTPRLYIRGQGTSQPAAVQTNLPLTQTTPGRFSATVSTATGTIGIICAVFPPTTGDIWIDDILIEQSPVARPHFDGTTPAAGDYTYNWTGTANASTSEQRAVMVNGTNASRDSSQVDSRFFTFSSTAEDGAKVSKWFSPSGTPTSTWRVANINSNAWSTVPVKAGRRYTLWFRWRGSGWGAGQTAQTQIADATAQNPVIGSGPSYVLNSGGWAEYRQTFTAIRDATAASTIYTILPVIPQATTDGIFEMQAWALYEGEYAGDYIDGTKPLAKWEGTPDASTSIGYPPQLLDIAGAPILDLTVANGVEQALPGGFTNTEPRTIYTVSEGLVLPGANLFALVTYGAAGLQDAPANQTMILRYQGSTNLALLNRQTGGGGPLINNLPVNSRHVSAWGLGTNGTQFIQVNNGAAVTGGTVMDVPHGGIRIQSDATLNGATAARHIRTIMYRGYHDNATRAAIARYLGNKYGATVA